MLDPWGRFLIVTMEILQRFISLAFDIPRLLEIHISFVF